MDRMVVVLVAALLAGSSVGSRERRVFQLVSSNATQESEPSSPAFRLAVTTKNVARTAPTIRVEKAAVALVRHSVPVNAATGTAEWKLSSFSEIVPQSRPLHF
jgi:hypothetical protein